MADLQPNLQTQQRVSRGSSSSSGATFTQKLMRGALKRGAKHEVRPVFTLTAVRGTCNTARKHSTDVYRSTQMLYSVAKWIERVAGHISELQQLIHLVES